MRKLGYAPNAVICMMRRAVSLAPDNCDYRRSLAAALSINGEIEAAYSLFTSISTDDICCKSCLKLMANVFEQFGDSERLAECQGRLFEIDSGAS
jgi:thioredoxin-like negative regulator of GroEL